MTRPIIRIHDTATDEVVDREMTVAEFKAYEADQKSIAERKAEAQAQATAKTALLERLGLTEDEAKLLLA
jgi:hypothetical protein